MMWAAQCASDTVTAVAVAYGVAAFAFGACDERCNLALHRRSSLPRSLAASPDSFRSVMNVILLRFAEAASSPMSRNVRGSVADQP